MAGYSAKQALQGFKRAKRRNPRSRELSADGAIVFEASFARLRRTGEGGGSHDGVGEGFIRC